MKFKVQYGYVLQDKRYRQDNVLIVRFILILSTYAAGGPTINLNATKYPCDVMNIFECLACSVLSFAISLLNKVDDIDTQGNETVWMTVRHD